MFSFPSSLLYSMVPFLNSQSNVSILSSYSWSHSQVCIFLVSSILKVPFPTFHSQTITQAYINITLLLFLQEVTVNIRGHQFVETTYHTPSNCDVCNKTLPWSINIIKKGEGSYECKRK